MQHLSQRNKNQGIALITVLVIAAILVVYATFVLNQRQLSDRRTFNLINQSRAYQYMVGAEEFAKSLLQQYFEQSKAKRVTRLQSWATAPMQFPIEDNQGTLEGNIRDMHSCFNLNSILFEPTVSGLGQQGEGALQDVNQQQATDVKPEQGFGKQLAGEKLFAKIIEPLLPSEIEVTPNALAATLRDWIDEDQEPAGADGAEDYTYTGYQLPYRTGGTLLADSSELLVIKGFTAEIYDSIKDYICVLPTKDGTINVNTVKPEHAELVWALLESVDLQKVRDVLQEIPDEGYDETEFFAALGKAKVSKAGAGRLAFDSNYLLLTATANIKTGRAETKSLLMKNNNEFQVVARHIGD